MVLYILHNFIDYPWRALDEIEELALGRYDNPFERKSFLENKDASALPATLAHAFNELTSHNTCKWVSRILDVPILYADMRHYGGVFVYEHGDYLAPHVDAGIHPIKGLRKIATALLYLTPSTLSTWAGDSVADCEYPEVWACTDHYISPNELVLFSNHDTAWHSVPLVSGGRRVVLTVSYMAPPEFSRIDFRNTHTRAYFAPIIGEPDPYKDLRLKRVSEEHHSEVYRTTPMENN